MISMTLAYNLSQSRSRVGKNAFIGARAMILPGVCIGDRAIVGAMSVVPKDVADHEIVAGNPAKKIGERPTS